MRGLLVAVAGLLVVAGLGYVAFGIVRDTLGCTAAERAPFATLAIPDGAAQAHNVQGRCVISYETQEDKNALYGRYAGDLSAGGWSVTPPPPAELVSGPLLAASEDGLTLTVFFTSPGAYGTSDPPAATQVEMDVRAGSLSDPRVESCYDYGDSSSCGYP